METPKSILYGEFVPLPDIIQLHKCFEHLLDNDESVKEKEALIFGKSIVTFQELNKKSNQLARLLLKKVSINKPSKYKTIAVCISPSNELIITLFAIIKSGVSYLPLDISFPAERISYILEQAEPLCVIKNDIDEQMDNIKSMENNVLLYSIQELLKQSEKFSDHNLDQNEELNIFDGKDKLACILYTSGSTGLPKGVKLSHKTIMNRLYWQWKTFPFDCNDVGCFKTALTFVDSLSEIFGSLLQGITVVIIPKLIVQNPEMLVQILEEHRVTRLVLVPTLLRALLIYFKISLKKNRIPSMRYFVCSGEKLTSDLLMNFFEYYSSGPMIANYYGSTEIMGDVTYETFKSQVEAKKKINEDNVPIGKPIFNSAIYIFDENLSPVPFGDIGEIFVSGLNVANGYVDSNSERFIPNPLIRQQEHQTLYKTGDYGKVVNGTLFYEGRLDSQIKIRGYRIDLTEIEQALRNINGVADATALCYKPDEHSQKIIAYYVKTVSSITKDSIAKSLRKSIPPYMMPILWEITEIPLLVNGKVDRQTLITKYENNFTESNVNTAPESSSFNELQLAVMYAVSQVLGMNVKNCTNSFFDIGGNSMNSIQTIWVLKQQGFGISIADFLNSETLNHIALKLKPLSTNETLQPITALNNDNQYKIIPLDEIDKHEAVTLIADCFVYKGVLERYLLHPRPCVEDYYIFVEQFWNQFVNDKLSFGLVKGSELLGVSTNFDIVEEPTEMILPPSLVPLMGLVNAVEIPVKSTLPTEKGKYFYNFIVGAKTTLGPEESIQVVQLLEAENVKLAKANKFIGAATSNLNPLTQQVCKHVLGYKVCNTLTFNSFIDDKGNRPYASAPNHMAIETVIKMLN